MTARDRTGLTSRQAELLAFIKGYKSDNGGAAPSFDEMRAALGLSSKSGVHYLISGLCERGFVRRAKGRVRTIELVADDDTQAILESIPSHILASELQRRMDWRRS